jgi:hypothetical protein
MLWHTAYGDTRAPVQSHLLQFKWNKIQSVLARERE